MALPVVISFLVFLSISAAPVTLLNDSPSLSNKHPESCSLPVMKMAFSLTTNFTSSVEKEECLFDFVEVSCGPVKGIMFSSGGSLYEVSLIYNQYDDYRKASILQAITNSGIAVVDLYEPKSTIFPKTDFLSISSNGVSLQAELECQCGYEMGFNEKSGHFCRITGASQTHVLDPPPVIEKTEIVYFPLDCRTACDSDQKCVLARYDYVKKTCDIHYKENFQQGAVLQEISANSDAILFPGTDNHILQDFGEMMANALEIPSERFMGAAHDAARQTESFVKLLKKAYFPVKELSRGKGSEDPSSVYSDISYRTLEGIVESVLSLSDPNNAANLPALNGPSTIKAINTGKEALSSLERAIAQLRLSAELDEVKEAIEGAISGQIEASLAQGNFDFQFLVSERTRARSRVESSQQQIEVYRARMESFANDAAVHASLSTVAEIAFATANLVATFAAKANPFSWGNTNDLLGATRDLQKALNNEYAQIAAIQQMTEQFEKLALWLEKGDEGIDALDEISEIADEFIESFEDGEFNSHVTEKQMQHYLDAYVSYKFIYSVTQVNEANIIISKGFDILCKQIVESSFLTYDVPIFYKRCNEAAVDILNMMNSQNTVEELASIVLEKTGEILSKYILMSKYNRLRSSIQKSMTATLEKKTQTTIVLATTHIYELAQRLIYVRHLVELCNLNEYYSSGTSLKFQCDQIRRRKDVLSTENIFTTLSDFQHSWSVPSNDISRCFYLPTASDDNGSFDHSINLQELRNSGETSFRIPLDDTWLRKYGWERIANGIERGESFFVKNVQLPLPFSNSTNSTCSRGIEVEVVARGNYRVGRSEDSVTFFNPGGDQATFKFEYSDTSAVPCINAPETRNFMEPCTESNDEKVFPNICLNTVGNLQNYLTYDTKPPLPSLFADLTYIVPKECVESPEYGDHLNDILINNTDGQYRVEQVLGSSLLIPICLSMSFTHAQSSSYNSKDSFTAVCHICDEGEFHSDAVNERYSCKKCPPGTFQNKRGQFTCLKCPIGTFQDGIGVKSGQGCIPCPDGMVCPFLGMAAPTCPAGTHTVDGLCVKCALNQCCIEQGASSPIECSDPNKPTACISACS